MNVRFDPDRFSRTLVRDAPDAVIYADASGLIQFWNSAAERIFGFSEAEALGRSLDIIVPENLRARHWNGYAETMRTGMTRYGAGDLLAVPAQRKDGQRISVEFTILPVRDELGNMIGVAAILRDVTNRFREIAGYRRQLVRLDVNMSALHAVRDVRCPFSLTIELIESFHAANPDHRIGPFGWARAHVLCEASRVSDVSDRSRLHEAFSFTWRGTGWVPLPVVHGFITVRPQGQLTRLTFDGQYTPPLGIGGRVFDAVLGRRVAQRSIQRLLSEMASFVEQDWDRVLQKSRI
jgi:PAS domain S-box-containing protein